MNTISNKTFMFNSKLIFFLFINFTLVLAQDQSVKKNASYCVDLYNNNTITTPCLNSTSCCFVAYKFYNSNITNCILKYNSTDDICNGLSDTLDWFKGSDINCDCNSQSSNYIIRGIFAYLKYVFLIIALLN